MSTFDGYGNRVIQHHRSSRQSGYRQVHNMFVFALMRLGLGLAGEDGSDYLTKDGRQ